MYDKSHIKTPEIATPITFEKIHPLSWYFLNIQDDNGKNIKLIASKVSHNFIKYI